MFTGKTVLALALSALLPASAAWAANKDTIIYCSEASPESFNPQIASSGPSFVASSQTLYNRLINFDPVKNTPVPSLAESWTISPDGKTYTFTLRKGVKFNSNKYFKPTRDFTLMTLFSPLCVRKTLSIPITMFPRVITNTLMTWASTSSFRM